ncbi:hypothetical protein GpartN1_g2806.t1 [Galdieria partita]|uniref:HMG box domain-containing protein n=1 Tax=Galdieria partita TaxID=83374 RepID=A0A9C7PU29_9RHOD|nr:hypothetical protein GpartN1_g2312.t1 [Galdieria partita]GJQ11015.1 hypothetical protein GpartN1_g2806.t1 [Galdieria partita]
MPKAASKEDKPAAKRAVSPYNEYMKKMLPVIKQQNPNLSHQEAFKRCAESWKDAPENPKNKASA